MKFLILSVLIAIAGGVNAAPIEIGTIESTIPDPNGPADSLGNLADRLEQLKMSTPVPDGLLDQLATVFEHLPEVGLMNEAELDEVKEDGQIAFIMETKEWAEISHFCTDFRNEVGVVLTNEVLGVVREKNYAAYSDTVQNIMALYNICNLANNFDGL